jgi:hypothetical protein
MFYIMTRDLWLLLLYNDASLRETYKKLLLAYNNLILLHG